jgi:hypothetical protein
MKTMKKNSFRKMLYLMGVLMLAAMVMVSCKKDDDDDDDDDPILVEDGFYIKGDVTPFTELTFNGMFMTGINEADEQSARAGMYEKYVTLQAGTAGFNIVQVAGATHTTWGPATVESIDTEGEREQPNITIQKGTLGTSGMFTVPSDGLYHIIMDIDTETFVIAPIPFWAIIGGATALGWADTEMPMDGAFSLDAVSFKVEDLELRAGDFKFRYGGGWKLEIVGEDVKANTNFGGEVSGTLPDLTTTLERGGANYPLAAEQEGVYTVMIEWTVADGFKSSLTKTGDVEPLDYPEELYMIGASVGGWDWANVDLPMIPVHSKPHLFWKIVWIEAGVTDAGYKFAPQKDWIGDFGYDGNDPVDGIYQKGGDNMPEPDESGYYMVVVNFETEEIAVVDPQVYLIGNTVGSWDTAYADALFTVDNANEVITLTRSLEADELRMYAWFDKGWFTDWWQSEFMILEGVIEFRGKGDDQERVNIDPAGEYKIDLNFRNHTGSIELQ